MAMVTDEKGGDKEAAAAGKTALKAAPGDHDWPRDNFGQPLVKIQAGAQELVSTKQFNNVIVGPVMVTRFVPEGSDEYLLEQISNTQALCERAVAEDRDTAHVMYRKSVEGARAT